MAGLLLLILFGDPAIEGNTLLREGRCADALPLLRTATQQNTNNALAWYDLGYCYRKTGQNREAAQAYRQYATLRPGSPDPYYGLGVALRALGDASGARKAFQTYIALEKRPSEQRWVERAREELTALAPKPAPLVATQPKPAPLEAVALPPVVAVAPRPAAAPVVAAAPRPAPAPPVAPPKPVPTVAVARPAPVVVAPSVDPVRAAMAERRWPVAEVELDRRLAEHPDDRAAFLLRAEVRRALGNPQGAAEDATRALALRPGDPTAVRMLGEALMAAGDRERGRYYLDLYRWLQPSGN